MSFAGIDVSKDHLDLAVLSKEQSASAERFANNPSGIEELTECLAEASPERVVIEATGGKISDFYYRLREKGTHHKKALVAASRKLLVILNTMVKNGEPWKADLHTSSP